MTCNYDVGSPNLFRGEITYSSYGYNVSWASAIVFLVLFSLSAGESFACGAFPPLGLRPGGVQDEEEATVHGGDG